MRRRSVLAALPSVLAGCSLGRRESGPPATNESGGTREPVRESPASEASVASRTTGIAPLAVFFDALSADSGVVQPPEIDGHPDFASLRYEWDFDDETAGRWGTTGANRSRATGPMAAHVFEQPGTYEVTLRVTDANGADHWYTQEIEVSPFQGTTYYVSNSGSDGNDGLSPDEPIASYEEAISVADADTRVLFARGDEWATAGGGTLGDGPGVLGAYGDGPAPHVRVQGANAGLRVHGSDWRVADLHFSSDPDASDASGVEGNTAFGGTSELLLLRVEVEGFRVGIGWSSYEEDFHRNAFVVDCHVHHQGVNGMYAGGEHLALLGTRVERPQTSHVVRLWQARRSVIGHNALLSPGGTRHAFKFHSPEAEDRSEGWLDTAYTVVSHNHFRGGPWSVGLGPQNAGSDERVHDILFENNTLRAEVDTRILLLVWGRRMTVRRNLFVGTGSSHTVEPVEVGQRGIEPVPEGNELAHNVVYRDESDPQLEFPDVQDAASETAVHHTLVSYPGASLSEFDVTNATSHTNYTCPPDEFVDVDGEDFRLRSDSALLEEGFERNVLQR